MPKVNIILELRILRDRKLSRTFFACLYSSWCHMDWGGLGRNIKDSLPTCLLVDPQLIAPMAGLANVGASLLLRVTFVFVRNISFSKVYLQTWNVASFHHSSLDSIMWLPEFT